MFFAKHPILLDIKGENHELKPDTLNNFNHTLSRRSEIKGRPLEYNTVEIEEGKNYMLFYWDTKWKKVGISKATEKGVFFKNIPSNALYLLLPIKPDRYERIFILEPKTRRIVWY